jgi:hypothetical protein
VIIESFSLFVEDMSKYSTRIDLEPGYVLFGPIDFVDVSGSFKGLGP